MLVTQPERVDVNAEYAAECVAFTLRVSPEDLQVVVGPNGRTSRSLRTIVAALGKRSGLTVSLEIKSAEA